MNPYAAFIPAGFQSILGIAQMLKGNSLANTQRPVESVPQGVTDATNLDRSQAASPFMPNYGFASNQIAGNTASAYNKIVQNSPSSASTLGNIGNLYANQNNQQQDLLMKGIDRQDKMKSQYAGQLNTLGQYQNQDWQWNEADPYLAAIKAANMQTTTGEKNIFAGLESGASGTMLSDLYNKLSNKGGANGGSGISSIGNGGAGNPNSNLGGPDGSGGGLSPYSAFNSFGGAGGGNGGGAGGGANTNTGSFDPMSFMIQQYMKQFGGGQQPMNNY